MPDDLRLSRNRVIPGKELEERASRSSGPGGQGVNTTDSAVELRWGVADSEVLSDVEKQRVRDNLGSRLTDEGVFIVRASEHRSQYRNRQAARERLVQMIRTAIEPPKVRRKTRPTRASKRQRLEDKRRRGETKRLRKPPGS